MTLHLSVPPLSFMRLTLPTLLLHLLETRYLLTNQTRLLRTLFGCFTIPHYLHLASLLTNLPPAGRIHRLIKLGLSIDEDDEEVDDVEEMPELESAVADSTMEEVDYTDHRCVVIIFDAVRSSLVSL